MSISLILGPRPKQGTEWGFNITRHAPNWRRVTRALGGYWLGDFTVTPETMSISSMKDFYDLYIGSSIEERAFGMVSWDGEIYQMDLVQDGILNRRSLDPEDFHNRVQVRYRFPSVEDIEQGALTYNPAADSFQDAGQDFSDWETLAGDAVYEIKVTNNDGTTISAFLGADFTTTNPNDSILVFTDTALTTAGWSSNPAAKTPISYVVRNVLLHGTAQATTFGENVSSTDLYGDVEYIDVIGESELVAAEALRDRRLVESAFPKSIPVSGFGGGGDKKARGDSLKVFCAGFVYRMNNRFQQTDLPSAAIDAQIATLVGNSEFVTAGRIETNAMAQLVVASDIPRGIWDIVEDLILLGDSSNNRYVGGVYADREFRYELAETDVTHYWRGGRLYDKGGAAVEPPLIEPNIMVRTTKSELDVVPPGSSAWGEPSNVWIESVEFRAPNQFRLIPFKRG